VTDAPDNLVLELLRAIRGDIAKLQTGQMEILTRLGRLEEGQARIRRDTGADAETVAHVQAQMDQLRGRLERIERRLDIID
jgi:ubiquinone biosynthesis protein UbiJ